MGPDPGLEGRSRRRNLESGERGLHGRRQRLERHLGGPEARNGLRADEQPDGGPGLAADITAESAAELRLAPGDRVYFSVKAQEVTVHLSP